MVLTKYICTVCKEEYSTEIEAKKCEGRFPERAFTFTLNHPYRLTNGGFDYCMFIGEYVSAHDKCPIVFKFNSENDEDEESNKWAIDTSTEGYYNEIKDVEERLFAHKRAKYLLKKIVFDKNLINEQEF